MRRAATGARWRPLRGTGPQAEEHFLRHGAHRRARQLGPCVELHRLPDHGAPGPRGGIAADVAGHLEQVALDDARYAHHRRFAIGPEPGRGGTDPLLPRRRRHHGGPRQRYRLAAGPRGRMGNAAARGQGAERGRDEELHHVAGGRRAHGGAVAERSGTAGRAGRPARGAARGRPGRLVARAGSAHARPQHHGGRTRHQLPRGAGVGAEIQGNLGPAGRSVLRRRDQARPDGVDRGRLSAADLRHPRTDPGGPAGAGRRDARARCARAAGRSRRRGRARPDLAGSGHAGPGPDRRDPGLLRDGGAAVGRARPGPGPSAPPVQSHQDQLMSRAMLTALAIAGAATMAGALAASPPALVNLNVPWADEFARDGLLQPVDALLGQERSRYLKSTLEDLSFGGRTYGFPLYSNVAVIAYNRQIFQAAGIPHPPRSLDEQLAFARQIALRTGKAGLCPALAKIDGLMMQQGLAVIKNGRAVFNSPAHVALIRKLADTYKVGGLLKDSLFAEDNFPAAIDAYKGGRLGMLLAPPTAVGRIAADARDIYAVTDVAPAPLGPTGIADGGWLIHFGVPAGVDKALLPTIGKFARYLTGDANQLAFAKAASVYPASARAAADPFFTTVPPNAGAAEKAVAAGAVSMPHSHTLYVAGVTDYDELRRSLVKAVEAGVTGRQDIQQALDQAVAIWNRKLARQFPAQPMSTSGAQQGFQGAQLPAGAAGNGLPAIAPAGTFLDTASAVSCCATAALVSTFVPDPDVDTNSAIALAEAP